MRSYEEHTPRKVFRTDIPGKTKTGRPTTGLRACEVMDGATWSRKSIIHTGDPISSRPTRREQQGDKMKNNSQSQRPCLTSGLGVP